ncbi:MAG: ABC transporter permease [Candidatus Bathyarchaeia archaeon]|nr:ABC transporter permease [Candidatus Bathyarchaeota archaeon]
MSWLSRLLGFRYFKTQSLIILALTIAAASFLFSFTALGLTGFYRGFTAYLGEGGDIIAVYNPKSETPYTGLVPAFLAERLAGVKGVLAVSPEVMAPCILNGEAVFLRGIMPEGFARLNVVKIVEGEFLNRSDINSAVVGENIAKRIGLKVGGNIFLLGVLADRYVELRVKGIFRTGSMLDDEILAPLHVGQWLRGASYNQVTLIRLKIDGSTMALSEIYRVVIAKASYETASQEAQPSQRQRAPQEQPQIPWTVMRFRPEDVGVEEASKYMVKYMEKYGATREALLTLSAAIFLFSSLTIIIASETIAVQHRGEIGVLRALGASKRLLKLDMLIKLSPWILSPSAAGMLTALVALAVIQENGYLQALSHTIPIQLDPFIVSLNFILTFMLASIGVLKSSVE